MWWKVSLSIVFMMAVCFVIGLYAGGAMYLHLTQGHFAGLA